MLFMIEEAFASFVRLIYIFFANLAAVIRSPG